MYPLCVIWPGSTLIVYKTVHKNDAATRRTSKYYDRQHGVWANIDYAFPKP